jgi:YHS domain-containing protein
MANQTKDPVCGMDVNPRKTQYKTNHQGTEYAFCCQQCLTRFKQHPEQYTKS